ncbi:MAG: CDP-alcohol phosphatidyltransferase family protein, partial [Proteobacteria bacterium]|nr:CDP-alcohol phosphatidyltransferase family protein [Pseudomonadota bacterium]
MLWIGPDADPLRRVAGLSLAARNERVARSAGAQRVFFVCPSPTRAAELRGALVSELPDCPVVSLDELPASASVTHDSHADEDVLLLCAHAVYHPEAVALLAAPHVREVSSLVDASGRALGAYRLRAETLREVLRRGAGSLTEVERAVTDARIPRQEVATGSGWSVIPVGDAASARLAADKLWAACRKPVDGLVSRNLNRHISLWISRRLVDTRITPNHISLLCIGLGLAAGALAAQGGYAWILAGAAVFQLNSIVDGIDGELARVKWAHSRLGELLDSVGDNLANFCFFGALAWASWRGGEAQSALAGVAGLGLWSLYLVYLYTHLYRLKRGDVLLVTRPAQGASGLVVGLTRLGRTLLRRDSFVMLTFLLALAGAAHHMLVVVFLGGLSVFSYACASLLAASRLLRARRRASRAGA